MREAIELKDATPMYSAQPLEVNYTMSVLCRHRDHLYTV